MAIRQAAAAAGQQINEPFTLGRTDATAEMTDVESFALLEPRADGFRNYLRAAEKLPPEHLLVERANLLGLTAPDMAVLVGGMRCLGVNFGGTQHGVLTARPGVLSNDFFVNLLDMRTEWTVSPDEEHVYEGRRRNTGERHWTATAVDLVFGSNSQLRAISEVYASDDDAAKLACTAPTSNGHARSTRRPSPAISATSKLRLSTSLTSITGGMPIEPERVAGCGRWAV